MLTPGSANPLLLLQSGDPLDELGIINRSIRTRASAAGRLTRTPGVAGNRKVWAYRGLWKRGVQGVNAGIFSAEQDANNRFDVAFTTGDQLFIYQLTGGGMQISLTSVMVFRDPDAHYDIEVKCNTNSGGISLVVNGTVQALTGTQPGAGIDTWVNAAVPHYLAYAPGYSATTLDAIQSFQCLTDGAATPETAFGQIHPKTNQWRPKSRSSVRASVLANGGARNGWGTNGFFLTFEDGASLVTLGYDKSQSDSDTTGANWTLTNISGVAGTTYDLLTDTPTNNFPVLDSTFANYGSIAGTISEGGLKFASSTTYHFTPCTVQLPSYGKWQAEFIPQDTVSFIGLADLDNGSGSSSNIGSGFGWYGSALYSGVSAVQTGLATMAANDKITVCADMDALSMKIYKNNVLVCTQALSASKRYAFACGDYYAPGATSCYVNFGQQPITYPQSGYQSLCTKNLKRPPVEKSTSAFVAVTDTGANIAATLAAARSAFGTYIDIIKRRDSAEGWRWIFSDDAANYLDSSSTAAKAAVPAFGGSSYVGYSLRVAAANGVATGRLAHTNGVADVVADGLAKSRKAIILKNEGTGSWYFYHPELTAGKLLYLEQTAGETTDATISAVTSSGFTVAAALPTGTYRWLALAEIDGSLKLGKCIGNGSADGTLANVGLTLTGGFMKALGIGNWEVKDTTRDKTNQAQYNLYLDLAQAEGVGNASEAMDILSGSIKQRNTGSSLNSAGVGYAYLWFGQPFRYANAR